VSFRFALTKKRRINTGEKHGRDDETRTRDVCRDRCSLKGFTTYKAAGTAKGGPKLLEIA
jgi:hypothetical protein